MKRYFDLLNTIAQEYNIQKGLKETEQSWKARIIYSLLGQTGYASLWDTQEDLTPSSIIHFKRRIEDTLNSILDMYPEMETVFSRNQNELSDEIYGVLSNSGYIYHEPFRVSSSRRRVAIAEYCTFLRGQAVGEKRWISGAGCYLPIEKADAEATFTLAEMFQLQEETLETAWDRMTSELKWEVPSAATQLQYLRIEPPFTHGYWIDTPDRSGAISLSRTGFNGNNLYFFYKSEHSRLSISQLPSWMTEQHWMVKDGDMSAHSTNSRNISVACLASRGALPPTTYSIDGEVVLIRIGYLFPLPELNLIKLYSWPDTYINLPHDFNRVMSLSVFLDIKKILEAIGYRFEEE